MSESGIFFLSLLVVSGIGLCLQKLGRRIDNEKRSGMEILGIIMLSVPLIILSACIILAVSAMF